MSDYCCFKYREINKRLVDSLVKSHLYFSQRKQINDPFDSNVDIARALDNLLLSKDKDKVDLFRVLRNSDERLNRFNNGVDTLGICSFSLTLDETLMWSHYSNNHKGICIRYDFSKDFLDNEDEILGVTPVTYEPNSVSDWLFNNIDLYKSDLETFIVSLLQIHVTSKAPTWKYEEEVRIIRPSAGLYEVPREALSHIIFGLQTPEADKSLIRSIIEKYYQNVKFGQVIRTNSDFGIGTEEI